MPDILEKYFSEQVFSNKTIFFILAKQYCFLINFRLHPTAEAVWVEYVFFEYRMQVQGIRHRVLHPDLQTYIQSFRQDIQCDRPTGD